MAEKPPHQIIKKGLLHMGQDLVLASAPAIPQIKLTYDLADIATSVSNWLGAMWLVVAFAVAIPLAFLIAHRLKSLFIS